MNIEAIFSSKIRSYHLWAITNNDNAYS